MKDIEKMLPFPTCINCYWWYVEKAPAECQKCFQTFQKDGKSKPYFRPKESRNA